MKKVRGCKGWKHSKTSNRWEYMYYYGTYVGCAYDYVSMLEYIIHGETEWVNLSDYGVCLGWRGM